MVRERTHCNLVLQLNQVEELEKREEAEGGGGTGIGCQKVIPVSLLFLEGAARGQDD